MDRNREARRTTNMAAPPNGLSSSRRRHRSSGLRDSPDEDGGVELQESSRLRDRGVVKKDRGDRDRDRERERERSSRSKRRRENRMMIHHVTAGSNRDDGDDTSEESDNDEDEEDDDDAGNGGGLPPPPANSSTVATSMTSNHHNPHPQQLHHRKSFPPANKVFRPAAPPPAWKATDEMIGFSVPRKARSASTKRSHEWISGGAVVAGGGGTEQIHRQSSTSPTRLASAAASPAPPSPSSSNVSVRKKMKANGGGSKPRPPKSSSKSSSSNPEELEIEIAEVLYGLMTQSQAPSKNDSTAKFDSNKSSSDTKSRVSSPISNSTAPPHNSTSLSTVAPKRKRPRQVAENPFGVRNSPVSLSIKTEADHHQHHQSPKTDISSPYLEHNNSGSAVPSSAAENGVSFGFTSLPGHRTSPAPPSEPPQTPADEEGKCGAGVLLAKEEVEKESSAIRLNDGNKITEALSTTSTNLKAANPEIESQKEEKFEIDLMAPPPQQRTSPENDGQIDFSDRKQISTQGMSKNKEDEKLRKNGKEETLSLTEDQKKSKSGTVQGTGESSKQAMNEEQLHMDLEKPNKDNSSNRSLNQAPKHQQLSAKSETHTEKTGQPSSMPIPMSMANWPPMGYVTPLQGVISMDGNNMPSAPIQQPMPIFTHPRPKKCATHCYIARNIHYLQQFMKINPFWPAPSGSAPMFAAKPSTELHANSQQSTQVNIFPGQHTTTTKENKSSQQISVPEQRKQQVLLQQTMPPVTSNNILHGPAFIFPFNQQQAVAASASVRPGSSKLNNASSAGGSVAPNSATVSAATSAAATTPALSFNYPNMSANETQYLAILQNNPYSFPIPAVGAPPNYRNNPHAQPMPLFNGSFYSSQMIHASQIQQPPQPPPPTNSQQIQQNHQNSSGSTSSSQKHLQGQQRQQQSSNVAVNGGQTGNGGYPATHKNRSHSQQMNPPTQARHLDNDATGGEESPSTADSRVSRGPPTMNVYSHNFAMQQNFGLMNPQTGNNSNDKKQQSQQQGLKRGGAESASLPPGAPPTFAMSFAPMNGATGTTMSSIAQNHAIFQSLPESVRQSYHHMMSAPVPGHHTQQKKDFRVTEEASRTTGHDSSNADEDRKGSSGLAMKSGQSIAFSRPDLPTDASGSSPGMTSVIDSSSRNMNLGSNNRSTRSPTVAPPPQSSHHLHAQAQFQQQQQQVLQLQKQHQQQQQQNHNQNQNMNARTKNPPSSNGSAYPIPDHLITSSSSMAAKFPNSLSSFPLQTTNPSSSPVQSPQWRNSVRGPTSSQVPSSNTSSLKNLHQSQQQQQQQQSSRAHQQSHTQISFGTTANQKLQPTASSQQNQNLNPGSNSNSNNNQSHSPPMLVGSPTTSSISKGGNASPRTNTGSVSTSGRSGQTPSLTSSQPSKNTPLGNQRSSPSILGNPHNTNPNKPQQQQQQKPTLQQAQAQAQAQAHMFFNHPYMQAQQAQAQQHSGSTAGGYYLPRKQQLSSQPPGHQTTSASMLSLCPPVTLSNTTTSDPAKAIAAATSNLKGGQYGGGSMPAGFPQYVHNGPPAVKAAEQKQQPAGD